ncbi:alpha/beta hydrolase [Kribbella hippodromi]|uniref:Alpha/beta hydrolase n=1 Tax=Kribbella hippodromi TaxID=434347 RepID=A0ABP4PZ96_9ACTN
MNPPSDDSGAAIDALVGGVTRRTINRGNRVLTWLEAGSASPSVVFEAGAMSPVVGFAAVFKALAPDHHLIAYDRAGYGGSTPVPLDLNLQLGDLIAVLEQAGPSIIVGHSWGGLLAQLATWNRPDLVTGLVLLDPAHEVFWQELTADERAAMGRRPDRTRPASADSRYDDVVAFGHELAEDVVRSVDTAVPVGELLRQACLSYLQTDEQLLAYLDELPMILEHLDDLAAYRASAVWPSVPVVLLTATKGRPEKFTPRVIAVQEELAAQARGRHLVVPDSGHYLQLDRPDLVVECVREVSRRRE